jgi:hypothetical protein
MAKGRATKKVRRNSKARQRTAQKSVTRRRGSVTRRRGGFPPVAEHPRLSDIVVGNRVFAGKPRRLAGRKLDILPDLPDIRDRIYMPHLRALEPAIFPKIPFGVRNQGEDSSCTGFALAHVVDFLRYREIIPEPPKLVSARMLYEMAKRNDEWGGTAYEGSSIRGAIKGFFRNGVCSAEVAPDDPKRSKKEWVLSYEMAREARETRLGAYYRLQPDISDYHAALNEVGIIYASAQIHDGWEEPVARNPDKPLPDNNTDKAVPRNTDTKKIPPGAKPIGGHAFAIVGYDREGFWVLNSWGPEWGVDGVAHWSYADWASTIMDAWVLQIGVQAPEAFGAAAVKTPTSATGLFGFNEPTRMDILGHFVNVDDGRLIAHGRYSSPTAAEMNETVKVLLNDKANNEKGYGHLVLYAHGGLNDTLAEARRIATWKRTKIFTRNRIYNFHLMWGTGLLEEVFDRAQKSQIAGGGPALFDFLFEAGPGKECGQRAWRNMKQDAKAAFDKSDEFDGGFRGLLPLLSGLDNGKEISLHLVGHSAGAILLGRLLSAFSRFNLKKLKLHAIHLMAPACTTEFFNTHYGPYLNDAGKLKDKIYLYNLSDKLELGDIVRLDFPPVPYYSRSLLYLVSRAFEETALTPLAGMQLHRNQLVKSPRLAIDYASGGATKSEGHGGFDNDAATLSTIMKRILGRKLDDAPRPDELVGY